MSNATPLTQALVHLRDQPGKHLRLNPSQPLTIGRAGNNRLALPSQEDVSEHHAVVRFSRRHGWLVFDWQSRDGTYLEGQRVQRCRPLGDGDEIQLGRQGPVLVFRLTEAETSAPAPKRAHLLNMGGETIPLGLIHSALVQSEPLYPHVFSWWVLVSVGLLLLLPIRVGPIGIFWPLQLTALAAGLLIASRRRHTLVVVLRDGRAERRNFDNLRTALAHRNGIRRTIGESLVN